MSFIEDLKRAFKSEKEKLPEYYKIVHCRCCGRKRKYLITNMASRAAIETVGEKTSQLTDHQCPDCRKGKLVTTIERKE